MESTQQDASGMADSAKEKAQDAAQQAQHGVKQQIDQRSSQLAEQINQQTEDLRAVSSSLREQGKDGPAQAADRLAGYAEKVGTYLRDKNADALLADAESLGRRQPLATVAGGLVVGLAASRFLKASSGERYRQGSSNSPAAAGRPQFQPRPAGGVPPGGALVPSPPLGAGIGPTAVGS